jgi:hypothetical protein
MLQIGLSPSSAGNSSIVGCQLQGTDFVPGHAASYANYSGGISGDTVSCWRLRAAGQYIWKRAYRNVVFSNAQRYSLLTYSPCGTRNVGLPWNNGPPGLVGPSEQPNTFGCAGGGGHYVNESLKRSESKH